MAQVWFTTADGKKVLTGYDRPLDYSFLSIEDENGEKWYDTLDEPVAFMYCAEDIMEKLDKLGVAVPADLRQRLNNLERWKVGNDVYRYPDNIELGPVTYPWQEE